MRKGLLFSVIVAAFVMVSGASKLRADQITLDDTTCTSNTLSASSTTPFLTGSISGCEAWWSVGTNTPVDLTYSITGGTGFSTSGGGNSLSGTINWTAGTISTNNGQTTDVLFGVLDVTSVSGFNGEFVAGNGYNLNGFTLDESINGNTTTWTPSSGEVPVPEPASLLMLGTGLLGLGGVVRRKFMKF